MNVTKLWVLVLKKGIGDYGTWKTIEDFNCVESFRVNGELRLPLFTSPEKAEQYVQNEMCLQVESVHLGGGIMGAVAGFLQEMMRNRLVYVVVDPTGANTNAEVESAEMVVKKIIAE